MNKQQFLNELRKALYGMPPAEIEKSVQFYSEMIDDRMEDGMNEEEAVASLGSLGEIVGQIRGGGFSTGKTASLKQNTKTVEMIVIIVTAPVWFSVYISAWMSLISFYITAVCLSISGLACIAANFFVAPTTEVMLFLIGGGCILIGLGMFIFVGTNVLVRLFIKLTKFLTEEVKKIFRGD